MLLRTSSVQLLGLLLLAVCMREDAVSIEVRRDGEQLLRCARATVSELTPESGGWAFECEGGGSLRILYESEDNPSRGTMKRVEVETRAGETSEFVSAHAVEPDIAGQCSPIKARELGPLLLPTGRGGVEPGTYVLVMVEPCAKLELEIGEI